MRSKLFNYEICEKLKQTSILSDDNAEYILSVPVVTPDGECYAVFELIKEDDKEPFNKDDLKVSIVVTGWMGAAIHQNLQRIAMLKQEELHDYLLKVTSSFFNKKSDCNKMVTDFMVR